MSGRTAMLLDGAKRSFGRRSREALVSCVTLFGCGCLTIDGTRGVPPFYEIYPSPSSVREDTGSEVFVRPFYSYESLPDEAWRLRSLPPLADLRGSRTDSRHRVLPFFYYRDLQHELGERDIDWFVFPLFLGGHDPEEGGYFAVFPLGGKIKGLLAQDDITFALFPLLWLARTEERRSLHLFWPFYNQVWGGDWTGWRLWPFYGRYRAYLPDGEKRYDHGFVLWPFYIRRREHLHDAPSDLLFTFPFYGRRSTPRSETRAYLWPFFQTFYHKIYGRKIYMGFLIPYRFTEGQTDVWPFFGVKKVAYRSSTQGAIQRRYRQFALWPLQRYDWLTDGTEESTRFWLLPLMWHFHYIEKDTLRTRSEWKFWPLFRHRREGNEIAFDAISPFWFEREEYDRYYSRWFHLFRYRWREELSGWELLWGAITYRRRLLEAPAEGRSGGSRTAGGDGAAEDSAERVEEKVLSLLGGLIEGGTRGGRIVFRVLWIPW